MAQPNPLSVRDVSLAIILNLLDAAFVEIAMHLAPMNTGGLAGENHDLAQHVH
jgi:hypothetical protein